MPPKSRYSVHPGILMLQDWIASLKEKTGRSLDEWLALIRTEGPKDEPQTRAWLKAKHGLGTNTGWWLAERALGDPAAAAEETPEGYLALAERHVEEQYAGKRSALRPIFERLLALGLAQGPDAKACPCKTMVPLYREHVFAEIKPATLTRVDLSLALKGVKTPRRLIDTGGAAKGDRLTHRIPIGSLAQIDAEVERWLARAYDLAAPRRKTSVPAAAARPAKKSGAAKPKPKPKARKR